MKTISNDLWSKIAPDARKLTETFYATSERQIVNHLCHRNKSASFVEEYMEDVVDVKIASEEITELTLQAKPTNAGRSNPAIAAITVGRANIALHKALQKIKDAHGVLIYASVDSIVYAIKKGTPSPVPIGTTINTYKNEYPGKEIVSFATLQPKSYAILLKNLDNSLESVIRCSGLNVTKSDLKFDDYENTINLMVQGYKEEAENLLIKQRREKGEDCSLKFYAFYQKFKKEMKFGRDVYHDFTTKPFGFIPLNDQ